MRILDDYDRSGGGTTTPKPASYLDAPRIVTRHGPNTIRFADAHRWGEEPDQALNRVVALNLERQAGIQSTDTVPWASGSRFDYIVRLRVLRFEGVGPPPLGPDADDDPPLPMGHSQMTVRWTTRGPDGTTTKSEGVTRHRGENGRATDYADPAAELDTSFSVRADHVATDYGCSGARGGPAFSRNNPLPHVQRHHSS